MIALKNNLGTDFVERVHAIFAADGLMSKAKNFEFRPEQQEMAAAVARALEEERHLVVEAGTGVGKSLAYLVPAIFLRLSKRRKRSSRRTPSICRSNFSTRTFPS